MPSIAEQVSRRLSARGQHVLAELVGVRAELGRLRYGADLTRDTPDLGAHMQCERADLMCYTAALHRVATDDDTREAIRMTRAEIARLRERRATMTDARRLEAVAERLLEACDAGEEGDPIGLLSGLWLAVQVLTDGDHTDTPTSSIRMWLRARQRGSIG
jgi:hypothetical protein